MLRVLDQAARRLARGKMELDDRARAHNRSSDLIGCGRVLVIEVGRAGHSLDCELGHVVGTVHILHMLYFVDGRSILPNMFRSKIQALRNMVHEDLQRGALEDPPRR